MQKNITILLEAPSVEASKLVLSGIPESGRIFMSLHNLSSEGTVTYRLQDSADGVSWSNKSFTVGESQITSFNIDPDGTHPFKVDVTQPHLRLLMGSSAGGADVLASVSYHVRTDKTVESRLFL